MAHDMSMQQEDHTRHMLIACKARGVWQQLFGPTRRVLGGGNCTGRVSATGGVRRYEVCGGVAPS